MRQISVVQIQSYLDFTLNSRDFFNKFWSHPYPHKAISTHGQATQVIAAGERYTKPLSFVNVSLSLGVAWCSARWHGPRAFLSTKKNSWKLQWMALAWQMRLALTRICLCIYHHISSIIIYHLSSLLETLGAINVNDQMVVCDFVTLQGATEWGEWFRQHSKHLGLEPQWMALKWETPTFGWTLLMW